MSCVHTKRVKWGINDVRTWWGGAQFTIPHFLHIFSNNCSIPWIFPPIWGWRMPGQGTTWICPWLYLHNYTACNWFIFTDNYFVEVLFYIENFYMPGQEDILFNICIECHDGSSLQLRVHFIPHVWSKFSGLRTYLMKFDNLHLTFP